MLLSKGEIDNRKYMASSSYSLTLTCPSALGQVADVVKFLYDRKCYISELAMFDDNEAQHFFMRVVFHSSEQHPVGIHDLKTDFATIGSLHGMTFAIHDLEERPKVLIMVSKLDHCLADLLFRWKMNELSMDIVAIVSNHPDLEPLAQTHGITFHHIPITAETKQAQELKILNLVEECQVDLVVLARYMQIFSEESCAKLHGKAINIHHSFLPGFKGAKPYHQAFQRGVKLIGATAHFITDDLDEGPIIEQVVERVDHSFTPEKLLAVGRDMECLALSRAVQYFLEKRLFVNGHKTVVLH